MRILLIGDYSGLHSALKKGLMQHPTVEEVLLLSDGDKFKDLDVDQSLRPIWVETVVGTFFRKAIHKIFRWDIAEIEKGWRAQSKLKNCCDFDVVQLINDRPIQTLPFWEKRILQRLFKQNKCVFLLSCGIDVFGLDYLSKHPEETSLLQPLWADPNLQANYAYVHLYQKKGVIQTQQFIVEHCQGIIASDFDYVNPNKEHSKYLGLIPHPVCIEAPMPNREINGPVSIFLGINPGNYYQKGIPYFEKALEEIQRKYGNQVQITIAKQLSYKEYQKYKAKAHIVLDQLFSKDQGYNALESMAMGQVVFTGADADFLKYYNLKEDQVCIQARPDLDDLVEKLSQLIENKESIQTIGKQAAQFVTDVHACQTVAKQYLNLWESKN